MHCCDGYEGTIECEEADKSGKPLLLTIQSFEHSASCRPPKRRIQRPKQPGKQRFKASVASAKRRRVASEQIQNAEIPTSRLGSISFVFERCRIPAEAVPFNMAHANRLENTRRLSLDDMVRLGFGGDELGWPRVIADQGQAEQLLPVEDLLRRCLSKLGLSKKTDPTFGGRLFHGGIESEKPSKEAMFLWFCNVLGRQYQRSPSLIMNIPMTGGNGSLEYRELWNDTLRFEAANTSTIFFLYDRGDNRAELERADANLTPRHALVHAHHDEDLGIFTVRTLQPLTPSKTSPHRTPGKLWIFYPPSQLAAFAGHDQDTAWCLANLEHGVFLVQCDGESIIIPPYLPHIVFTLETCYLAGSMVPTHDGRFIDRRLEGGFLCDAIIGGPKDDPWMLHRRLRDDLEDALQSFESDVVNIARLWRAAQQATVRYFVECPELWEEIVGVWMKHIRQDVKLCPFCVLDGARLAGSAKRHLDLHVVKVGGRKRARLEAGGAKRVVKAKKTKRRGLVLRDSE